MLQEFTKDHARGHCLHVMALTKLELFYILSTQLAVASYFNASASSYDFGNSGYYKKNVAQMTRNGTLLTLYKTGSL